MAREQEKRAKKEQKGKAREAKEGPQKKKKRKKNQRERPDSEKRVADVTRSILGGLGAPKRPFGEPKKPSWAP